MSEGEHRGRWILSLAVFSILVSIALGIAWYLTNNNLEEALQRIEEQTALIGEQENKLAELSEDLEEARIEVNNVKIELETTKNTLSSTQETLSSTQQTLILTQSELAAVEEELQIYKDTWGSVVTSELRPPFLSYNDVQLSSNSEAIDTTWEGLKEFIINDETDEKPYVSGSYVCGEFAKDVHNNAEKQGIKTAWVAIKLEDGSYHALNAFKTKDRGLVFIDCTGIPPGEIGPPNRDKVVDVSLGNQYIPKSIVPQYGWGTSWGKWGRVLDIQIYW